MSDSQNDGHSFADSRSPRSLAYARSTEQHWWLQARGCLTSASEAVASASANLIQSLRGIFLSYESNVTWNMPWRRIISSGTKRKIRLIRKARVIRILAGFLGLVDCCLGSLDLRIPECVHVCRYAPLYNMSIHIYIYMCVCVCMCVSRNM